MIVWLTQFALAVLNIFWWIAGQRYGLVTGATNFLVQVFGFIWPWARAIIRWCLSFAGWVLGYARAIWETWVHPFFAATKDLSLRLDYFIRGILRDGVSVVRELVSAYLFRTLYVARDTLTWVLLTRNVLPLLRDHLVAWVQTVQAAFVAVQAHAFDAFRLVVAKLNLTIAWINHSHHELGVIRENVWWWSTVAFLGDLQRALINLAIEGIPRDVAAQLAQLFPTRSYVDWILRWRAGSASTLQEYQTALARFRAR